MMMYATATIKPWSTLENANSTVDEFIKCMAYTNSKYSEIKSACERTKASFHTPIHSLTHKTSNAVDPRLFLRCTCIRSRFYKGENTQHSVARAHNTKMVACHYSYPIHAHELACIHTHTQTINTTSAHAGRRLSNNAINYPPKI